MYRFPTTKYVSDLDLPFNITQDQFDGAIGLPIYDFL